MLALNSPVPSIYIYLAHTEYNARGSTRTHRASALPVFTTSNIELLLILGLPFLSFARGAEGGLGARLNPK